MSCNDGWSNMQNEAPCDKYHSVWTMCKGKEDDHRSMISKQLKRKKNRNKKPKRRDTNDPKPNPDEPANLLISSVLFLSLSSLSNVDYFHQYSFFNYVSDEWTKRTKTAILKIQSIKINPYIDDMTQKDHKRTEGRGKQAKKPNQTQKPPRPDPT